MLKAVRELGEYVIKDEGLDEEEIFVQKTDLERVKKVICVVFKQKNGRLAYHNVHRENYEPSKSKEYLYRTFDHGQYDVTPTAKITTIEKVKKRWELWFGSYSEEYKKDPLILSLSDELQREKDTIFNEISRKYEELDKEEKRNSILTIKIKEDGTEKYLGEFDIFRIIFKNESRKKLYTWGSKGNKVESKGEGICSLCEKEAELWGFASPFPVYTVDKRGFAPCFLREDSWKRLPICANCAVSSVAGREFLDKYLLKKFYGYRFYVIPRFTFSAIQEGVIEIIKDQEKREYTKSLLGEEDDILDLLKEKKDALSLIFVFLKPKQKYFDIVKYVEAVPPSWIKNLFNTFKKVSERPIFREESLKRLLGKDWTYDFTDGVWKGKKVSQMDMAGMVRTFFPTSKETGMYDKYFLDVIGDILAQRHIDKDLLINAFIREIRNRHAKQKEWEEKLLSTKSLYLLTFITELGLIKGGDKMSEHIGEERINLEPRKEAVLIEDFFTQFEHAFNTADKKAVFLEGVLVRFLLDIQYRDRKTTPFRSKLHGLKLDEGKIKKLLPEITEKLREYKAGYYHWLEELISKYLLMADNNCWRLSKDEISYYFALGLNLGGIFKVKEKEEEGKRNG